jgi:DNA primase
MSGTIPRPFIDDLIDRVDIVEIIDQRVKLKKSGKNYSACCPFHDEKTPSFTVSPDKQFYYCFGCGATGNAIGFIMEYDRLGFPEAVESLAKNAGLEVPKDTSKSPEQRERDQAKEKARKSLYELMEAANDYYQQQLRQHPKKLTAVDYLKRRGLTGQIAKEFGIGYSPPGWENIAKLLGNTNARQDQLLEAGMIIHNEDKDQLYDRFRDRIMFPIRDTRGRVVGFGGRVLTNEKPKYLNSPETPIFHKGKELYGLFEARQAYKQLPRILVVEGYMDVVALAQYGIRYGVATLGTACGEDHLRKAFRFTNEIVFCFDGDEAGRKAAKRAMEIALPTMEDGRQIKFLYLPEGEDPDTLVRHIGTDKFTRLIEGASPLETFLFEELAQGINTQTMEGKARLCKLAAPLLDQLPKGIYRELMLNQLANRSNLSIDALSNLMSEIHEQKPRPQNTQTLETDHSYTPKQEKALSPKTKYGTKTKYSAISFQETTARKPNDRPASTKNIVRSDELALALLLFQPKLAHSITDLSSLSLAEDSNIQLLVEIIQLLHQRPEYSSGQILGHWQGAYGPESSEYLQSILQKGLIFHHIRELDQQGEHRFNPEKEFLDAIHHLQKQQENINCQSIIQQLNSKPLDTWTEAEKQLYSQAIAAQARLK